MAEMVKEEVKNTVPKKDNKEHVKNLKYQRDKDRELVKGIFRYHEVPGGAFSFVYKKYKEDEVETYTMVDGQVATVPLGVAKHLNNNVWYPMYDYVAAEGTFSGIGLNGTRTMKVTKKVRRCSFQSLEFLDVEGVPTSASEVVMVEATAF